MLALLFRLPTSVSRSVALQMAVASTRVCHCRMRRSGVCTHDQCVPFRAPARESRRCEEAGRVYGARDGRCHAGDAVCRPTAYAGVAVGSGFSCRLLGHGCGFCPNRKDVEDGVAARSLGQCRFSGLMWTFRAKDLGKSRDPSPWLLTSTMYRLSIGPPPLKALLVTFASSELGFRM